MLKIMTMSQDSIEHMSGKFLKPHAIISVTPPEKEDAVFEENENCVSILRLKFIGLDPSSIKTTEFTHYEKHIFKTETAMELISFCSDLIENVEAIICSCEDGESISQAIAAGLNWIFNGTDMLYSIKDERTINDYIYRKIISMWMSMQLDTEEVHTLNGM